MEKFEEMEKTEKEQFDELFGDGASKEIEELVAYAQVQQFFADWFDRIDTMIMLLKI